MVTGSNPVHLPMNLKEDINPSGQTVVFRDDRHTYNIKETGKQLKSCTKFIKIFFPKFDEEFFSKKVAEAKGITPEEVKEEWKLIREKATDFGSLIHKFAETYLTKGVILKSNDSRTNQYYDMIKILIDVIIEEHDEILGVEKIIFSERLGIAGTVDLIMRKGSTICIYDWKTGKGINKENKYKSKNEERGISSTAFKPIIHLDDCNYNRYSLQLNLYKKILIEENYFPETKYIMMFFHISDTNFAPYVVRSLDKDIQAILEMSPRSSVE